MTLLRWLTYGLLTGTLVYVMFPETSMGGLRGIIVLLVMMLLGSLDQIASQDRRR